MFITHQYKKTKITKEVVDKAGLILGNNLGDYFYMTNKEETRYQGFFYADGRNYKKNLEIYKVIDKINFLNKRELTEIKNNFFEVEKIYKNGMKEKYFLPNGHNSICLEINKKVEAEIILDIRRPYDSRSMGRIYKIEIKRDYAVIKFVKRKDKNEDGSENKKEFSLYIAIKTDQNDYKKIGEFFSKYYQKDYERNSYPWDRFVYKALKIKFAKAVFSVSKNKKDAIQEVKNVFANFDKLNKQNKKNFYNNLKTLAISDQEIKMAYLCAQNSIQTMVVENGNKEGTYAGLPWFFQFWHRDEAVSLLQIYKINKDLAQKIILSQLGLITSEGQVPRNRFYESEQNELQSADALGWLANRIMKIDKEYKLSEDFKIDIIKKFEKVTSNLMQKRTEDELAINYKEETWMDSIERGKYCIEIQACRYNIYDLLYKFTNNDQYKIIKDDLKNKILAKFWQNDILKDCINDTTIRPNIFIVAYLMPELLDDEKWEKCFDKILPKLYLSWGGLSSIDITSAKFISKNTGEDSASYHNGDSWYWINNLTAIVLYKLNVHKYSSYINAIMEASTNEILYYGIVAHHSEISAAEKQTFSGSCAQLWSCAMYLEALDEILDSLCN